MKNYQTWMARMLCALLALLTLPTGESARADTIEGIVAVVDNRLIMQSDLDARLAEVGIAPDDRSKVERVLDVMVEDIVVEKTYAKYGLPPVDTKQIAAVAEQNKTTYAFARTLLMRKMLMDMMVSSRVVVTPQMVRDYYDLNPQYSGRPSLHLEQIAIKGDVSQASTAMAEIKAGKPFGEVAKARSEILNQGSPDIGWMALSNLDDTARTALEKSKVGDVVGPLEIGGHACIFKVLGRETTDRKDFEEVRAEIQSTLEDKARDEAFEYWLKLTMSEHFIYKQSY